MVSFEILFQDMSWSWSCLKISFKRSLGIGLERQKNQDKINTEKDNNKESKKMDIPPKFQELFLIFKCHFQNGILTKDSLPPPV